jgi:hypothetical protein
MILHGYLVEKAKFMASDILMEFIIKPKNS